MKNSAASIVPLIVLPILVVGLNVPLVLGRVRPNPLYGLRTPKTLSSPEIWYKANRLGGINMILATVLALVIWSVLALFPLSPTWYVVDLYILVGLILLSVVITLFQVRHLP